VTSPIWVGPMILIDGTTRIATKTTRVTASEYTVRWSMVVVPRPEVDVSPGFPQTACAGRSGITSEVRT